MTNNIDMVFSTENTNMIAETRTNVIDTCINTISPAKLIQCTKKHCKWYTPELTKLAQHKNRVHKIAKQSNTEEDWRILRNVRNKYTNLIKATK